MTAEYPYTLQWAGISPSNLPVPLRNVDPPSNTCIIEPTRVLNPIKTAFRLVQSFLEGSLLCHTDRQRYLVNNNRPHLQYVVLRFGLSDVRQQQVLGARNDANIVYRMVSYRIVCKFLSSAQHTWSTTADMNHNVVKMSYARLGCRNFFRDCI